jgi:membrane dipeptidase
MKTGGADPSTPGPPAGDVAAFHRSCLVLDSHTDVPMRLYEAPADLRQVVPGRHVDLPRLRAGGVDAVVFALYVPPSLGIEEGYRHALELARLVDGQLVAGELELARSAAEVRATVERGAVAVLLGLENGRPLGARGALADLVALGVRYVTLTHVASHEWCDASTDVARHGGLSSRGRELVAEMNARGVLVDVSHASDAAVEQVLALSWAPVVASHSSARALCDHPRNLPDDLVRGIAASGGVVMANAYPAFLDPEAAGANAVRLERILPTLNALEEAYRDNPRAIAEARSGLFSAHPLPPVPLARYVEHILHLVAVAGPEHVGIGTDFDGIPETPAGFEDVSRFPDLTATLLAAGLETASVRGILGENFLAAMARAEALAA